MEYECTQALPLDDFDEIDDVIDTNEPVGELIVPSQHDLAEATFSIYEGDNIIGRDESCKVYIPNKALSKEHACIEVKGNTHMIYDKGSRNRTKRDELYLAADVRYELKEENVLYFANVQCVYKKILKSKTVVDDSGSETGSESMLPATSRDVSCVDETILDRSDVSEKILLSTQVPEAMEEQKHGDLIEEVPETSHPHKANRKDKCDDEENGAADTSAVFDGPNQDDDIFNQPTQAYNLSDDIFDQPTQAYVTTCDDDDDDDDDGDETDDETPNKGDEKNNNAPESDIFNQPTQAYPDPELEGSEEAKKSEDLDETKDSNNMQDVFCGPTFASDDNSIDSDGDKNIESTNIFSGTTLAIDADEGRNPVSLSNTAPTQLLPTSPRRSIPDTLILSSSPAKANVSFADTQILNVSLSEASPIKSSMKNTKGTSKIVSIVDDPVEISVSDKDESLNLLLDETEYDDETKKTCKESLPVTVTVDEPTQAYGKEEPTQAYGNEEPTQAFGEEPAQAYGNEEPTQAFGEEPAQAYGNEEPTQAFGEEPVQAYGNEEPTQAFEEEPAQAYGNEEPTQAFGEELAQASDSEENSEDDPALASEMKKSISRKSFVFGKTEAHNPPVSPGLSSNADHTMTDDMVPESQLDDEPITIAINIPFTNEYQDKNLKSSKGYNYENSEVIRLVEKCDGADNAKSVKQKSISKSKARKSQVQESASDVAGSSKIKRNTRPARSSLKKPTDMSEESQEEQEPMLSLSRKRGRQSSRLSNQNIAEDSAAAKQSKKTAQTDVKQPQVSVTVDSKMKRRSRPSRNSEETDKNKEDEEERTHDKKNESEETVAIVQHENTKSSKTTRGRVKNRNSTSDDAGSSASIISKQKAVGTSIKKGNKKVEIPTIETQTNKPVSGRGKRKQVLQETIQVMEVVDDAISNSRSTRCRARGRSEEGLTNEKVVEDKNIKVRKTVKSQAKNTKVEDISKGKEDNPDVNNLPVVNVAPVRGRGRKSRQATVADKEDLKPEANVSSTRSRSRGAKRETPTTFVSKEEEKLEIVGDVSTGKVGRGRQAQVVQPSQSTSRQTGEKTTLEAVGKTRSRRSTKSDLEPRVILPTTPDVTELPNRRSRRSPKSTISPSSSQQSNLSNESDTFIPPADLSSTPPASKSRGKKCKVPAKSKASTAVKPSLNIQVMFTGVVDKRGEEIVKDLGGQLNNSVMECTHLVTDRVRRTIKFLCCLSRGIPIVSTKWLERSEAATTFLDCEPFVIKDNENERKFSFSLKKSLSVAAKERLLEGYRIHVTKAVKPDPPSMKEIVESAGANYLSTMPKKLGEKVVIVSCEENIRSCQAAVKLGIPVVSAEFILTGILRQEIDPISYALQKEENKTEAPRSTRKRRGAVSPSPTPTTGKRRK